MTQFSDLALMAPLQRAVEKEGYSAPTPIQAQSIPHLLEGRDLLGVAQTGTGKTAAFVLPMLHSLASDEVKRVPKCPRALILAPTRELAGQIHDSIRAYGGFLSLRTAAVFGGVPMGRQIKELGYGVDILVATPGRLLDLMKQRHLRVDHVGIFILDEADRMLDLGFVNDVRHVASRLPSRHQTVLFSATMPAEVQKLADGLLRDPVRVEVTPQSTTAERIDQTVCFVEKSGKSKLLASLLKDDGIGRVLIFTRTKRGADRVAKKLLQDGEEIGVIHGDKSQGAREKALKGFRSGKIRALVATDIAARGIDVDGVTHVINFDLPNEPESYVHRIGRTARAGAEGKAISFCDDSERPYLYAVEKATRQALTVREDHPFHSEEIALAYRQRAKPAPAPAKRGGKGGRANKGAMGAGYPKNKGKARDRAEGFDPTKDRSSTKKKPFAPKKPASAKGKQGEQRGGGQKVFRKRPTQAA